MTASGNLMGAQVLVNSSALEATCFVENPDVAVGDLANRFLAVWTSNGKDEAILPQDQEIFGRWVGEAVEPETTYQLYLPLNTK